MELNLETTGIGDVKLKCTISLEQGEVKTFSQIANHTGGGGFYTSSIPKSTKLAKSMKKNLSKSKLFSKQNTIQSNSVKLATSEMLILKYFSINRDEDDSLYTVVIEVKKDAGCLSAAEFAGDARYITLTIGNYSIKGVIEKVHMSREGDVPGGKLDRTSIFVYTINFRPIFEFMLKNRRMYYVPNIFSADDNLALKDALLKDLEVVAGIDGVKIELGTGKENFKANDLDRYPVRLSKGPLAGCTYKEFLQGICYHNYEKAGGSEDFEFLKDSFIRSSGECSLAGAVVFDQICKSTPYVKRTENDIFSAQPEHSCFSLSISESFKQDKNKVNSDEFLGAEHVVEVLDIFKDFEKQCLSDSPGVICIKSPVIVKNKPSTLKMNKYRMSFDKSGVCLETINEYEDLVL